MAHPAVDTRPAHAHPGWTSAAVGALLVVGFLARLVPVLRGAGLHGILAYDDGVYFGAADAVLSGRLPYRDFLLLHPPGVLLVLAPFAALGRLTSDPFGMAVARLAFMAVGALNAVLAYGVARRAGRLAALAAGALYAVWGPAAYAERTTLLEPLVNLGVLAALLLLGDVRVVTRRRVLAAGAVLGVALTVKVWAVVPLVVVAVWVLRRRDRSAAGAFVAAAALVAGVVCLPFLWAAPGRMLRMVLLDQLGRPSTGVTSWRRLAGIAGAYHAAGGVSPAAAVVAAVAVLFLVAMGAVMVARTAPQLRIWVALLAAQTALLLIGPAYYDHYATFVAPALCLVVGASIVLLVERVDVLWWRPLPLVALLCGALALGAFAGPVHRSGRPVPAARINAALGNARCVRADSTAALVEANLLTRDLRRNCPLAIDVTGTTYDLGPGQLSDARPGAGRSADAAWQRFLASYVAGADAFLVVQPHADGFGPGVRAVLAAKRVMLRARHLTLYDISGSR